MKTRGTLPRTHQIGLELDYPDQLFETRGLNPLKGRNMPVTGMDMIYMQVRVLSINTTPVLVLTLPPGNYDQELIAGAIRDYCDLKIKQARMEHRVLNRERYFGLATGFFFMMLCLGLSFFLAPGEGYPELVRFYLKEGLFIVGWVGMWRPTEILIFDWWPYRKLLKTYTRIKKIKPAIVTREF